MAAFNNGEIVCSTPGNCRTRLISESVRNRLQAASIAASSSARIRVAKVKRAGSVTASVAVIPQTSKSARAGASGVSAGALMSRRIQRVSDRWPGSARVPGSVGSVRVSMER
jgi:hypothetical protein